jgi:hypothetical protein
MASRGASVRAVDRLCGTVALAQPYASHDGIAGSPIALQRSDEGGELAGVGEFVELGQGLVDQARPLAVDELVS